MSDMRTPSFDSVWQPMHVPVEPDVQKGVGVGSNVPKSW